MFFLHLALVLVLAAVVLMAGRWAGKKLLSATSGVKAKVAAVKDDVVGLKRSALDLAIELRGLGFRRIPSLLDELVLHNDPGTFLQAIKDFATMLKGGNQVLLQELEATFERALDKKLETPEGRALVQAKLSCAIQERV